jgi:hypothetical protein
MYFCWIKLFSDFIKLKPGKIFIYRGIIFLKVKKPYEGCGFDCVLINSGELYLFKVVFKNKGV